MVPRHRVAWVALVVALASCGGVAELPDASMPTSDSGVQDSGAPAVDSGTVDAGTVDAGEADAGGSDAGAPDAAVADAGTADAGGADGGAPDAATGDAGVVDGGPVDAGTQDSGLDAGRPDAGPDGGFDGGSDAGAHLAQGVYLYDYDNAVLDLSARATILTYLRTNGYTQVYLSADQYFLNSTLTQLRGFVTDAKTNYGIDTLLLFSNYDWALDANHAACVQRVQAGVAFIQNTPSNQPKPIAIQLDVEPHALPGWDTSDAGTIQDIGFQYLGLLDALKPVMNGVHLQMVIAFHYDNKMVTRMVNSVPVTRPLSELTIDNSDSTLMMDYRDVGTKLESGARDEIVYATSVHKQVVVAVKAKANSGSDQTDNFSDEGYAAMRAAISTMETIPMHRDGTTGQSTPAVPLNSLSGYGGWGVFAYTYLRALGP